ncbi:MAG: DUF6922 domain-containing protein [Myxococcota bacterium]
MATPAAVHDIPGAHAQILWDVDEASISLEEHAEFLIGRVLASGSLAQVDWLRKHYGDKRIRDVLVAPGGVRHLSARDVQFWSLILGIAQDLADRLIDEKLTSPWGR